MIDVFIFPIDEIIRDKITTEPLAYIKFSTTILMGFDNI